jgi:hypothetical protein
LGRSQRWDESEKRDEAHDAGDEETRVDQWMIANTMILMDKTNLGLTVENTGALWMMERLERPKYRQQAGSETTGSWSCPNEEPRLTDCARQLA